MTDMQGTENPTSVSPGQGNAADGLELDAPTPGEVPDAGGSGADGEPEDLLSALEEALSRDVADDSPAEADEDELVDVSKLLAQFDYSKIFARFDITKIIGQFAATRLVPDYATLFDRIGVDRLLPDYSRVVPALPELAKVVLPTLPDYSKLIATLAGRFEVPHLLPHYPALFDHIDVSRLLPDYSRMVPALPELAKVVLPTLPDYSKLIATLAGRFEVPHLLPHYPALFDHIDMSRLLPPAPDYLKVFDHLDVSVVFGTQLGNLAALMREWSDVVGLAGRYLRAAGRSAYAAALEAREAILGTGDEGVVVEFIRGWLKMWPTRSRIEAVAAVLLEPEAEWMALSPLADSAEVVRVIRRQVNRLHRDFRLITETQVNRRRIVSLEEPWASQPDGSVVPLRDLVAYTRAAEMLPETFWTDERITRVLGRLSADEYRVAITYTTIDDSSWTAAAELAGMAPGFGERVRRKLQRLGKEFEARQLAQAVSMTLPGVAASPAVVVDRVAGFPGAPLQGRAHTT